MGHEMRSTATEILFVSGYRDCIVLHVLVSYAGAGGNLSDIRTDELSAANSLENTTYEKLRREIVYRKQLKSGYPKFIPPRALV